MNKRKLMEAVRTAAEATPEFGTTKAAAAYYRKWRDRLLAKLSRAAARDGVSLGDTPEDLAALEEWSFRVFDEGSFDRTGLAPGELADALRLHVDGIGVRGLGAEWVVYENWMIPGRFGLGVRHGLATYGITPTGPGATDFWTGRGRRKERVLVDRLARFREEFERGRYDRVMKHRARMSPDTDRRSAEERLLKLGLNPWKEQDVLRAYVSFHGEGLYRQNIRPLLYDKAICGEVMRRGLRRFIKTADPVWRADAIRVLAALGDPAVAGLCTGELGKAPDEHVAASLIGILAETKAADAAESVHAVVDGFTRRKRRVPCPELFGALGEYVLAQGRNRASAKRLLDLLAERWARLHDEEKQTLAELFPSPAPAKGAGRGPRRVTVTAKHKGRTVRRSLIRVGHRLRSVSFID